MALLCDAATVREGLLHLLGAPITRMWRQTLPAPLNIALGVILCLTPEELPVPHEVSVEGTNDLGPFVQSMGAIQAGAPAVNVEPGERLMVPFAQSLHLVGTAAYGRHSIRISVDNGTAERQVEFWVLHPEEQQLPNPL